MVSVEDESIKEFVTNLLFAPLFIFAFNYNLQFDPPCGVNNSAAFC